jgi:pentatricopeptide repeat protein
MFNALFHMFTGLAVICLLQGCVLLQTPQQHASLAAPDAVGKESMLAAYHYSLGVLNLLDENSAEAIAEFEKARQFDPKSPALASELAILYSEKGDFETSMTLLREALKWHPQDVDAHFLLAGVYTGRKDYPHALASYRKVIALDPKHILAHLYLGSLYAQMKDHDNAIDVLRKLLAIDPGHVIGRYYLAKVLMETKQDEEAEIEMKKALSLRPSFEPAMTDLGFLYERQDKFGLAIGIYEQITKMHPNRLKVRMRMGELLLREKREAEADKVFREILLQQAANKEAALTIGLIYLEQNRYDRAVELLVNLHATYPDDQKIHYLLAAAYSEANRKAEALEILDQIAPDSEFYVNARIHAATILKKEGNADEAVKTVRKAVSYKKDAPALYLFLASLYDENKDYASVEQVLLEGLEASPQRTDMLYSLGVLYEKTGRFDEAIRQMRLILAMTPDHPDALNFIGYSYADRNIHLDEAEELIRKAVQLKPGNAYIIDSLGWVYFRQNKLGQAIELLTEAHRLQPDDVAIGEHLGDAYVQNGDFMEALDIYQRMLKLSPDSKTLPGKIKNLLNKR